MKDNEKRLSELVDHNSHEKGQWDYGFSLKAAYSCVVFTTSVQEMVITINL